MLYQLLQNTHFKQLNTDELLKLFIPSVYSNMHQSHNIFEMLLLKAKFR